MVKRVKLPVSSFVRYQYGDDRNHFRTRVAAAVLLNNQNPAVLKFLGPMQTMDFALNLLVPTLVTGKSGFGKSFLVDKAGFADGDWYGVAVDPDKRVHAAESWIPKAGTEYPTSMACIDHWLTLSSVVKHWAKFPAVQIIIPVPRFDTFRATMEAKARDGRDKDLRQSWIDGYIRKRDKSLLDYLPYVDESVSAALNFAELLAPHTKVEINVLFTTHAPGLVTRGWHKRTISGK